MANQRDLDVLRIDRSARAHRGQGRVLWVSATLVVLILLGAGWLWLLPGRAAEVQVATARQAASGAGAATVLNASGYVTARRRATVSSKLTGKLVEVHVEEGLAVEEGQVLARLDDAQLRAGLALARSQLEAARRSIDETAERLELARRNQDRTRRLRAGGVSDEASLDTAETEVRALEARLALERERVAVAERTVVVSETELADTVIRAPFAGVVISKDAQAGEMVSPVSAGGGFTRTGICTIVDMSSLEIEVDVNESYIRRVRPGQKVEAVLDAYPDWRIPAHVITAVPTADRQKATVLVRIAFEQLDPRILPDMGVGVAFQEERGETGPDARVRLVLPKSAARRLDEKDVVLVVDSKGRIERRAVTLGATTADEIEIVAGLAAGERVVIEGPEALGAGDRVRIRDGS